MHFRMQIKSKGIKQRCRVTGAFCQCFNMPEPEDGRKQFKEFLNDPRFKFSDE